MYEATSLTVKALREVLASLPDDAVVAGECCQSSSIGHVVETATFDDYRDPTARITVPAVRLVQADGTTFAVLNVDADYVSLRDYELDDEDAEGVEAQA